MKLRWSVALLFPLLFAAGCAIPVAPRQTQPAPQAPVAPLGAPPAAADQGHDIQFEVTTADGSVDMVNWSTLDDSALEDNTKSPFVKRVRLERKTGIVGVNASDASRVRCRLTVDGKVVDEGESDFVVNCSFVVR